uniref:Saposin B-type domain-containing protein n=1 Tax=Trichobilharzia regenti TaxID=157069 RepID=A0AA85K4K1_TRIRE|nr:unnamed protein product [Trichobilharzia regenti]
MVILCLVLLFTVQVVYSLPAMEILTTNTSGNHSSVDCKICLSAFSVLHFAITDPYWKQVYEMILAQMCTLLSPGFVKTMCTDLGATYLQQALTLISDEVQPEYLCRGLKKCKTTGKLYWNPKESEGHWGK